MTEQTEGAETFRGYIDAEAAATRSFIAYKFGEVSEAEVHRLQRIAHAARERHLAALAAAEARGKCPCACCRERAALVAASRDPAGRWCSCSSYAEAEQCDCTPCAALREGLARGAQAERARRMDYAAVKGYELGYAEGAQVVLAAVEAQHAKSFLTDGDETWGTNPVCDWDERGYPCETLRAARAAAAAAGGGGEA